MAASTQGFGEVTQKRKTRARSRPAKSGREASNRWGLDFAGAAQRGEIDVYTGEHFAADVKSGAVSGVSRDCPRRRPERDCWPGHVPQAYRSTWTRRGKWPGRDGRHVMTDIMAGEVCYDCRCWIEAVDRSRFVAEFGHYRLEDGSLEVASNRTTTIRDAADIIAANRELFAREQRALDAIVGLLDVPFADNERYEQATMLAHVKRCLARYAKPTRGRIAMRLTPPNR